MMSFLEQYQQAIHDGRVVVCERFRLWIDHLVEDTKTPTYDYRTKEPHIRIRWIERFCIQSKGEYYGKRVVLSLWQKAFVEVLYGFKRRETGLRRFTEAFLMIGRKNGKSTLMACLALYDLVKGQGITTACVSNSDAEAKLIWSEIDSMRGMIDPRSRYTARNIFEIRNRLSKNFIIRMSSTQRNLDGRNISISFFDEAHECMDAEIYEATTRAMGSAEEPLMILCTTNGYVRGHFLDEKLTYAHGVCDGEIEDDSFLPWLYEMDSEDEIYTDRMSWRKANPALDAGIKKWAYLDDKVEKAKYSEQSRRALLCKEFNIGSIDGQSFLNFGEIEEALSKPLINIPKIAEDRGRDWVYGVVSVDLSKTSDLTCACYLWHMPDDPTIYAYPHFWIPKRKLLSGDDDSTAGAKYTDWESLGYLTITDDSEISGAEIADWIKDTAEDLRIYPLMVGHDRWQSRDMVASLDAYGIEHEPLRQGYALSASTYRLTDDLTDGRVYIHGNECMAWCLGNLKISTDTEGNIRPIKTRSSEKVDGAVTLIMGIEELRQHRKELEDANR